MVIDEYRPEFRNLYVSFVDNGQSNIAMKPPLISIFAEPKKK